MSINIYGVVNGVAAALPMVSLLGAANSLLGMDSTATQLEYKSAFYKTSTNQFYVNGGAAATPGYSFSGDLTKGTYDAGANAIGESIAGAQVWGWGIASSLGHVSYQRLTMSAKLFQEAKSADANAGATVDVDGLTGNYGYVNNAAGATTVTSLGGATVPAGTVVELKFVITGGSVTLQNNGVSFIMLAGADIALQSGDICRFRKINSAQAYWEMVSFQRGTSINPTLQNLTVLGNTQLGDAGADTLTIYPNAVTWVNNPTHSGNHIFSGTVRVNGVLTLGGLTLDSGAASSLAFKTNAGTQQFEVKHVAGSTRWVTVVGSAGTPLLGTSAGDLSLLPSSGWVDFAGNSAPNNPLQASSGLSVGWNRDSGGGSSELYCHPGGGTNGGLRIFNWDGATATLLMSVTQNGVGIITTPTAAAIAWSMRNSNAGNPFGANIIYTAVPNDVGHEFLQCLDNAGGTLRASLRSNGGLANFSANNVNLSDEGVKNSITPLVSFWSSWKAINWVKYKLDDQTHDDWNFGYTAQNIQAAFKDTAPELVDYWDQSEGTEVAATTTVTKSVTEVVLVEGVYTIQSRDVEEEIPAYDEHPVFNGDGTPLMIQTADAVLENVVEEQQKTIEGTDEEGGLLKLNVLVPVVVGQREVTPAQFKQVTHRVQKMVKKKRTSDALAVYDHDLGNIGGKVLQEAQARIEALEDLVQKLLAKVGPV